MSLTEREKEIALEVAHRRCKTYRHKAEEPYSFDDDCMIHAFDTFLSRIREEHEPVAWRSFDILSHEYNYIDSGIGNYSGPLFTTPPAAPSFPRQLADGGMSTNAVLCGDLSASDVLIKRIQNEACSELVEALEEARTVLIDAFDALNITKPAGVMSQIDEALSNHAKRMKGEE